VSDLNFEKFRVYITTHYGMEDPQPGGERGSEHKLVDTFDSFFEAEEFAKTLPDEEFYHFTIITPPWYREVQHRAYLQEQARLNREANDPSHLNYVPF
jgi:hypothetical protein